MSAEPYVASSAEPIPGAWSALSIKESVAARLRASKESSASISFLTAMNACITASALPHPVIARNAGLVPSWQRWSAWQEGKCDETSVADCMMTSTRYNFDGCVDMVKDGLRIDPVWRKGVVAACAERQLDTSAVFAAAPLMFWRRPHALIELTPALQQLLDRSDLGADIPVGLLRPPMPACFIRFGESMHLTVPPAVSEQEDYDPSGIAGVYVFEAVREEMRSVAIVAIWAEHNQEPFSVSSININIGDEKAALVDVIERICATAPDKMRLHHVALAQLCTKVFLYWNVEQARREKQTPYSDAELQLQRLGPKKAAKLHRHVDKLYDRFLLGPLTLPGNCDHAEVAPHWRRGHFRMQPHGPQQSLRKVIFIAPTLVRADRFDEEHASLTPRIPNARFPSRQS